MPDGKIYITISDERKETSQLSSVTESKQQQQEKTSLFGDFAKHQFFDFVQSQANQFVSYTVSNIGNFTGNYQTQRQVQETLQIGKMITNVGVSMLAGSKFGLPGALIAGGIAIASQGINLAYQSKTLDVQTKQQNREIEMIRSISGLNELTNGSRWGM